MLNNKSLLTFLSYFLFATFNLFSQVGINTESPNKLSELEVTNLVNDQGNVVPKGIMIPRMTEEDRAKIDITDPNTANSLMIYNTDEDCYNYFSKTENEWKSLCGAMGKAEIDPVACANIIPNGIYVEGTSLDGSNYLSVTINVTKAGSYTISFTTSNGYSFYSTGVALDKGPLTIIIPGQGKPASAGLDDLSVDGLTLQAGCTPQIEVATSVATYAINCSSITANGQYLKGTPLTASNTITVNVNVSEIGSYNISTPVVNGIHFTGTGNFTSAGTHQVTLLGEGTPTVNTDFPIEINTNTPQGNNTCTATIPITLPPMTYAIIGRGDYSWASPQRINALTNGGTSFGPNGLVKISNFTQLWRTDNVDDAAGYLNNGFSGKQPDIVLYFAYGASPNTAVTTALRDYINAGGCVIYGSADGTSSAVNTLMSGVFGMNTAQAQVTNGDDDVYPIALSPNDPIINGPFGNLAGKYWGEDNASNGSVIMTQLPPNSVQICTAASAKKSALTDPEYSIVWYNDSKNFLYIGDSVASTSSSTATDGWPAIYTSSGFPKSKTYGPGGGYNQTVHNSALELNAVAWAIKKAAISGINPH